MLPPLSLFPENSRRKKLSCCHFLLRSQRTISSSNKLPLVKPLDAGMLFCQHHQKADLGKAVPEPVNLRAVVGAGKEHLLSAVEVEGEVAQRPVGSHAPVKQCVQCLLAERSGVDQLLGGALLLLAVLLAEGDALALVLPAAQLKAVSSLAPSTSHSRQKFPVLLRLPCVPETPKSALQPSPFPMTGRPCRSF